MMQATCLLWRLSLFNKLSIRRYIFAFSASQKSALRDVNRDFAMWIKMLMQMLANHKLTLLQILNKIEFIDCSM